MPTGRDTQSLNQGARSASQEEGVGGQVLSASPPGVLWWLLGAGRCLGSPGMKPPEEGAAQPLLNRARAARILVGTSGSTQKERTL